MNNIENEEKIEILEGIISVNAAIEAGKRKIVTVFVDLGKYKKRDRKITHFVGTLKARGIKYELCERSVIDAFVAEHDPNGGHSHGGVAAAVSARKYDTADDLLEKCAAEKGYIVFLDGVEDPFNLGYALRSLYAFGVTGVILPKRDFSSCSGVLARSSAGASELCPTALAELDTPEKRLSFIDKLRSLGIALDCAAVSSSSIPADEYVYPSPFILFIGGEKRGISPEFVENANVLLHIPYARDSVRYSLPTADAASIFGMAISGTTRKNRH